MKRSRRGWILSAALLLVGAAACDDETLVEADRTCEGHFDCRLARDCCVCEAISAETTGFVPGECPDDECDADRCTELGVCPVEETDCGPFERVGVEIESYGASSVILDGNRGEVGTLMGPTAHVNVQAAWQYHELWCDGAPATWYQLALVVPPSL